MNGTCKWGYEFRDMDRYQALVCGVIRLCIGTGSR